MQSDVYGFGVVLVQMLTGIGVNHPKFTRSRLHHFISSHLTNRRMLENIIDIRLEGKYSSKGAVEMAQLAVKCLMYDPLLRPSMEQVVEMLVNIESAN